MKFFFAALGIFLLADIWAQESTDIPWDIDSFLAEGADEVLPESDEVLVMQIINRREITFSASYGFSAGISAGWTQAPWVTNEENNFSLNPGAILNASFGMDARLSEVFRVNFNINFVIPDSINYFRFKLGEFFFDYNFFDRVFVRGGKYNLTWGISPNYGFTNLPNRIPQSGGSNEPFMVKADIPIGIGGLQFLVLTRANLFGGDNLGRENIGFGAKYNLARREYDLDVGALYQYGMPLRAFLSLKTTLGNTELYTEGLLAFYNDESFRITGAANLGFAHEFLDDKLAVNGEFFFNNEKNAFFYSSQTDILEAEPTPFVDGLNVALNLLYRFNGKGNPRFFLQAFYSINDNSAQIIPGFRISPFSHIEAYLAFPMSLGSKEGYYYKNPSVTFNGNAQRFAVVLLVSLSGSLMFTHYLQD